MKFRLIISILVLTMIYPETLQACATCFGDPDALATKGMNKAIAAMLGVTGGVLGGFGSLIFVLRKRAINYSDKIQSNQIKEEE
ncbi:MAG: hypothetical protein CBD04_005680 [bacterium TMED144]|nr:MAG: hypothetical protein CBD04_005680 [bacterium TMED144]|tara:strand:+ start:108 stop:359 length:252 start_codon:yes stop_codon:yes gene_type:complete